ncbi:MAG: DNA/RNA non-specific endonuclease [Phycisphaerae bacterium]
MRVRQCAYLSLLVALVTVGCASPERREEPATVREAMPLRSELVESAALDWPALDLLSPVPHMVFGEPTYVDHDETHNVTRRYGEFTVYYDDRVLAPRWAAIKMTSAVADANSDFKRPSRFKKDPFLPDNGFVFTTHKDYNNLPIEPRKWDRGHIVQFDDVRGYGDEAGRDSMFTTNICPQLHELNAKGWLTLEQRMTEFARDYDRVWLYIGPIYGDDPQPFAEGRRVPAPEAFYRIAVREADDGGITAVAFVMPHEPIPRDADLNEYLTSVDEIEMLTGLDFLHQLPDAMEDGVESAVFGIWPDLPNEP